MTRPAPRIRPPTQGKRLHRLFHLPALFNAARLAPVSLALLSVLVASHATAGATGEISAIGAVDAVGATTTAYAAGAADCARAASADCYQTLPMPDHGGNLHYYTSRPEPSRAEAGPSAPAPPGIAAPTRALIALHGHSRDANKTFDAALRAVHAAGAAIPASGTPTAATADTLVIAPLFQVAADRAERCSSAGVPPAQSGDLLWTCASWMEGGRAINGGSPSAFEVLDALVDHLSTRWPSLQTITVAGFSAGGQMVQRYIAFAKDRPAGAQHAPHLRYVVADPSSWLYFDPERPQPVDAASCPTVNQWKYGTDALPTWLGRNAQQARAHYAAADISYLQGALDNGPGKGKAYRVLDRTCAANAQGTDRLARGLAYAQYDRTLLAPDKARHVVVVPGCAHDVACVFPSEAARSALLGPAGR